MLKNEHFKKKEKLLYKNNKLFIMYIVSTYYNFLKFYKFFLCFVKIL